MKFCTKNVLSAFSKSQTVEEEIADDFAETKELRQKLYSETRSHLLDQRQSSFEHSDNLIVTLSSAFLALSVGFVKDVVPLPRSIYLSLLIGSWIAFFVAILVNFVSHFSARKAIELADDHARFYYLDGKERFVDSKLNRWRTITEWCNGIAAVAFCAGTILTLYFVAVNVNREQEYQIRKADESTKTRLETGRNRSNTRSANTAPNRPNATAVTPKTK